MKKVYCDNCKEEIEDSFYREIYFKKDGIAVKVEYSIKNCGGYKDLCDKCLKSIVTEGTQIPKEKVNR